MQKISSPMGFIFKRVFPVMAVVMAVVVAVALDIFMGDEMPAFIPYAFGVAAIVEFVVLRWAFRNWADAVVIEGGEVVIRNGGEEDRIPFAEIQSMDSKGREKPVVLVFKTGSGVEKKAIFIPLPAFLSVEPELKAAMQRKAKTPGVG